MAGCGGSSSSATAGGGAGSTGSAAASARVATSSASSSPGSSPSPAQPDQNLLNFARCMRANGVPNFPDPKPGGGFSFPASPAPWRRSRAPWLRSQRSSSRRFTQWTPVRSRSTAARPRSAMPRRILSACSPSSATSSLTSGRQAHQRSGGDHRACGRGPPRRRGVPPPVLHRPAPRRGTHAPLVRCRPRGPTPPRPPWPLRRTGNPAERTPAPLRAASHPRRRHARTAR